MWTDGLPHLPRASPLPPCKQAISGLELVSSNLIGIIISI